MPQTTPSTHCASVSDASVVPSPTASAGEVSRAALLRALLVAVSVVAIVGGGLGALLFRGTALLSTASLPFYMVGIGAAVFAAMFTVWLHGRFAATTAPQSIAPQSIGSSSGRDLATTSHLVTARLQSLLAAAFVVKLAVLVLGVLALKQFPLGEEAAKFSELATFAVTFAGAALLCQLGTAFTLARSLRRQAPAA